MKKIIYIFRHGETDANAEKRMQGWLDMPLNANGMAQAQDLSQKLSDIKFDSPLSRAFDTARAVVGNQQIVLNSDLREWNMGDFCGHIVQLNRLRADFAKAYKPRKFTKIEKEMLLGELINFATFRFDEIKYMSKKSWSKSTKQQNR